jgi:hypothetical protein
MNKYLHDSTPSTYVGGEDHAEIRNEFQYETSQTLESYHTRDATRCSSSASEMQMSSSR